MGSWTELDVCLVEYRCLQIFEGTSSEIISNLLDGKYRTNIESVLSKDLFMFSNGNKSFQDLLIERIEEKLKHERDITKIYEFLCLGISSLQLFVQVNWTGPFDANKYDPPLQFLRKSLGGDSSESEWLEKLTAELVMDGESIPPNIHNLELLLVARALLTAPTFTGILCAQWWRMRLAFIYQMVLEEHSLVLYDELTGLIQQLSENEVVIGSSSLSTQLGLETATIWLHYGHVGKADIEIKRVLKLLGLEINLMGALGKRTKFQEKEVAQLTLSINIARQEETNTHLDVLEPAYSPKDVRLEDDVRLNQIAFSDSSIGHLPSLTAVEQAAVLASCVYKQKSQPKDRLHSEEVIPYLTCLTAQPKVWALQMSALLQRSKFDSDHRRTVERAMMQFQSLSDSVSAQEPSACSRLAWVYCSHLPPAWRIEALLAHSYLSLGMVQTALDAFLRLQLWEEVIACYNYLKLRHKAEEIIRQELEKKKSVKLLCLLGDATDDVDFYRQAWELSAERSSRAQRHWAMYYFTRKQYAESIPHLEKSLALNSLQEALWFRLGYAALDQENWDLCATAYRRYCALQPESFEAWNNLAKAYVKNGQKARAFRALQEAVKCNYENWRVWDNLMAVSTDCAQFDEVIRCYHRILDLNEKHVDLEVLKILTNVVIKDMAATNECPTEKLRKQSLTLFGRLTSQVLNNSTLWQLYAQLAASEKPSPASRTKAAQCLQKAYRAATQGNWERDTDSCQQVITLCIDLAKAYVECSSNCTSSNESLEMLSSAKLPLKSVLSKIEKEQADLITGELPENINTSYKELLSHYEQILNQTQRLQFS